MLKKTLALGFTSLLLASPAWAAPDWSAVDRAIGRAGAEQAGGVHRYSFPRSDLSVTLDGVTIKPSLALGSWAAFQPMGDEAMVMGYLVLTHDEVNPVMSRLLASGFTITALHNHLLRSSPATMYMHIAGHGDPVKLAAALRQALSASRSEEHTSELQSLMRISYAVFCLKNNHTISRIRHTSTYTIKRA